MKRRRGQMMQFAHIFAPMFLEIPSVEQLGIFGSLAMGRPFVGDLDILAIVDSQSLTEEAMFQITDRGYGEGTFGQLSLLYELVDPNFLTPVDRIFALGSSWGIKLDVFVFPSAPSNSFLDEYYCRTSFGFLRHIAKYTKVFQDGVFVQSSFSWATYAESINWLEEFALLDGWGHLLELDEH